MSATPTIPTNVKSITQGKNQPGTYKVYDDDGNVVLFVDKDNERIDVGRGNGVGFWLRALKGLDTWEIRFVNNTSMSLHEFYGIVAGLGGGNSGDFAFRVQDNSGNDVFQARDDGHIYLNPATRTTNGLKAGLVIYNKSTNKLNFYNGSAWEVVTSA